MASSDQRKEWAREYYERAKLLGMCVLCGKRPAAYGRVTCLACAKRSTDASRRRYEELKAKGICPVCGKVHVPQGQITCDACLSKQYARKARQRAEGRCVYCGQELPEDNIGRYKLCPVCREKSRQRYYRRKNENN